MEYLIKELILANGRNFKVDRGRKIFNKFPARYDEVTITVSEKCVKTEIIYIEDNIIFVERITE